MRNADWYGRETVSVAPLLSVRGVSKRFTKSLDLAGRMAARLGADLREETVHAVDHVNLDVFRGEVVGLVGESGCGKSTLGRMITGLMPVTEGAIFYNGVDRSSVTADAARLQRLAVQMIFQDPSAALNPRMRVEDIIGEAPVVHGLVSVDGRQAYVAELLRQVGLDPEAARRFPHQFSGGQRSRINIARALAVKPEFLVCDEAIAALDVSIQAQVINLFMELKDAFNLTYLFICARSGGGRAYRRSGRYHVPGPRGRECADGYAVLGPNHPYAQALLRKCHASP